MNSILNFVDGNSSQYGYTQDTEVGFRVQGNIGSIIIPGECDSNLTDVCYDSKNITDSSKTFLNQIISDKNSWVVPKREYIETPIVCSSTYQSLSGEIMNQPCNFKTNNQLSPEFYGVSTFGVKNISSLNDKNNIGNQINNITSERVLQSGK